VAWSVQGPVERTLMSRAQGEAEVEVLPTLAAITLSNTKYTLVLNGILSRFSAVFMLDPRCGSFAHMIQDCSRTVTNSVGEGRARTVYRGAWIAAEVQMAEQSSRAIY